jgi:hypothetical protein
MKGLGWPDCTPIARPLSGTLSEAAGVISAFEKPPVESTIGKYSGHLACASKPGPDFSLSLSAGIEQWCLPSRRQQLARPDSEGRLKAVLNSEELKSASNRMAERRRTRSY